MRRRKAESQQLTIVSEPSDFQHAWEDQYDRLASRVAALLPRRGGKLAEVGCGIGQLTIPLARLAGNWSFDSVDNYKGDYSGGYSRLIRAVAREHLSKRIRVSVADYSKWLGSQSDASFGAVVTNEFLPEVDSSEMTGFLSECRRVLNPNGITVHSFLSPLPHNARQRLLIEADSDPRWTKSPPKEWFSPPPGLVSSTLRANGFSNLRVELLKSGLITRGKAAQSLLRGWGVRQSFWNQKKHFLLTEGLELPDWTIVTGTRPSH